MTTGGSVYNGIYTRTLESRHPVLIFNTNETITTTNHPTFIAQYGTMSTTYFSGLTRSTDGSGWYLFKDFTGPIDRITGSQFTPGALTKESLTLLNLVATGTGSFTGNLTVAGTTNLFSATSGTFQVNQPATFGNNIVLTSSTALVQLTATTSAATSLGTIANSSIYTTGGLGVVGKTYLTGDLTTSANIIDGGTLTVTGGATMSSTLTVTGATTLNGSLTTNNAISLGNYALAVAPGTTSPFINIAALTATLPGATSNNYFITIQSPTINSGSSSTTGTLWVSAPTLSSSTSGRNSAIYAATGDITVADAGGRLSVLGTLAPSSSSDVANAAINSLGGMIIAGATYLNAALVVGTAITSGTTITAGTNLSTGGTITSAGNVTINSTSSSTTNPPDSTTSVSLYTQGGANIARKLYVGQEAIIVGSFYTSAAATFANSSGTPLLVSAAGNLTVQGTTTTAAVTIGGALTLNGATNINGTITLNSGASISTTSMTNNFDFSGSTGTFVTSTGTNTLNGNTSLAANKTLTFAAGSGGITVANSNTGNYDFSASSGTFATSGGAGTLNGTTTVAAGKSLLFAAGAGGITVNATNTGAYDFSASNGAFKTTTGAVTLGGTSTITFGTSTGYSVTSVATTGAFNLGNMTGAFTSPTGAVTLSSSGNTTAIAGALTVAQGSTFTGAITANSTASFNGAVSISAGNSFTFGSGANFTLNGPLIANSTATFGSAVTLNKNLSIAAASSTTPITLANSIGPKFLSDSAYIFSADDNTVSIVGFNAFRACSITSGSVTIPTVATLYIESAPTVSGGATATNSYAFYVAAGAAYLGSSLAVQGTLTVVGSTTLAAATLSSATISGALTVAGAFTSQTSAAFTFAAASGTGATTSPFFNLATMTYSLTSGTAAVNFVTIQAPAVTTNTSSEASTFVIVGPPTGATAAWAQKIAAGGLYLAGANSAAIVRNSGTATASTSAFDTAASISTAGGLSVQQNGYFGTTLNVGTGLTVAAGGVTVTAGTSSMQAINAAGDIHITSATDGINSLGSVGSLATLGGISVAKKIYGGTGLTISAGGAAITGNSTVTGTLTVSAATTLQTTLDVTSGATIGGALTVTGATTLNTGLSVTYTGGISGNGMTTSSLFNIAGTTYTSGSGAANIYFATFPASAVSGVAASAATLYVGGAPTGAGIIFSYALLVGSGISKLASTDAQLLIDGTNDAANATDSSASLRTSGGMAVAKNLYVGINFGVGGISSLGTAGFSGPVTMTSTLSVAGAATMSNTLNVIGVATMSSQLYVSNANDVVLTTLPIDTNASFATQGGISVAKAASINGILASATQLKISATTDSSSYTDTAASIYTAGGATVSKVLNVGTHLNVQQNANINGNLTVSGTITTVNSETLTISNHIAILNSGTQPSSLLVDSAYVMARNGTSIIGATADDADKVTTTLTSNYTGGSTSIVIAAATALDYYKGWIISDGTNTASISASPAAISGSVTLTLDAALAVGNISSGSTIHLYMRRLVGVAWDESDYQLSAYAFPRDASSFNPAATDGSAPKRAGFACQDLHTYGDAQIDGDLLITGTISVAPNPVTNSLITGGSYTLTLSDIQATQNFFVNTAGTITLPLWSAISASVAAAAAGRSFIIRIVNLSTGTVSVAANGSDTIDGTTNTYALTQKYEKITLMSAESASWIII